ncbi:thioredoxin [Melghirimyces profundicolus]|uniref:Thioredoxin n=1 Tax=Melghirimyces profundicolus TaxID=1242148 RepID=A0A2T6BUB6_9BACL|nr:thioredoxin family protein [Melghirimyces profundicolus]PTX59626.1 thioredoxin [Melghirimyces profundicolus]
MEKLDNNTFRPFISSGEKVVEFSASWCFDCKRIKFFMPDLETRFGKTFRFGELDVDEARKIAEEFGVKGVPAFIVFREGVEIARLRSREAKKEENIPLFLERVMMDNKSPA